MKICFLCLQLVPPEDCTHVPNARLRWKWCVADHSEALHKQDVQAQLPRRSMAPEAEDLQSINLSPYFLLKPKAKPLEFPRLNEKELIISQYAGPSVLADCSINDVKARVQHHCVSASVCKALAHLCNLLSALPSTLLALYRLKLHTHCEALMAACAICVVTTHLTLVKFMQAQHKSSKAAGSSVQPLQLRHAASPSPDAALSPVAAALTTDIDAQMPANTSMQVPLNVLDSLLDGGSPVTELCTRHKLKSPPPRTKSTRSRTSKQTLPELRQSLLSRPSSMHIPDAAESSDGHTHSYPTLQNVDSQPCCGVWQKLSNSLSAVWRWLCKSGSDLKKLGRRVRKKLMKALGMDYEAAQRLLAEQQAEEVEALVVRPNVPSQSVEQPHGTSR